ncbi:MAG: putative NAD(P)/FAD-binding protein YdhS [Bacteroidia bacterium]
MTAGVWSRPKAKNSTQIQRIWRNLKRVLRDTFFQPHRAAQSCAQRLRGQNQVQGKFKKLLHDYKVTLFREEHENVQELTKECMAITEEVLSQKFNYHFHKLPDANRAEIINMINNYTREAILPPVIEKLVERQVAADKRFRALETLMENVLATLSEDAMAS